MLLCKNYLQHSITNPLACKKKDNVYCAVTGDNKQKAHMFFREVQMQLLYNSLLLHPMWKPRYFITRVPLPRHNQEKYQLLKLPSQNLLHKERDSRQRWQAIHVAVIISQSQANFSQENYAPHCVLYEIQWLECCCL